MIALLRLESANLHHVHSREHTGTTVTFLISIAMACGVYLLSAILKIHMQTSMMLMMVGFKSSSLDTSLSVSLICESRFHDYHACRLVRFGLGTSLYCTAYTTIRYHYLSHDAPLLPAFNSTLINGAGRWAGGPDTPLAVINVQQGKR